MDFIKRHYEKILLCAVLLGLVGALVLMGIIIQADKQKSDDIKNNFFGGKVQPLLEIDFTRQTNLVRRLQSPSDLDFSTTNKLFNPLQWQRRADGILVPVKPGQIGPDVAVVTKITPLYFTISLNGVTTNELGARYAFSVERPAAALPAQRRPQPYFASVVGEKNPVFTLTNITGPPENPDQLGLILSDGTPATVSKNKPYQRVDGYSADLKYDPEGLKWPSPGRPSLRVGSDLKFAGDDYNIVAIHQNDVIISAQSNQKRTTLRYAP